jgi:hypothetical protein
MLDCQIPLHVKPEGHALFHPPGGQHILVRSVVDVTQGSRLHIDMHRPRHTPHSCSMRTRSMRSASLGIGRSPTLTDRPSVHARISLTASACFAGMLSSWTAPPLQNQASPLNICCASKLQLWHQAAARLTHSHWPNVQNGNLCHMPNLAGGSRCRRSRCRRGTRAGTSSVQE